MWPPPGVKGSGENPSQTNFGHVRWVFLFPENGGQMASDIEKIYDTLAASFETGWSTDKIRRGLRSGEIQGIRISDRWAIPQSEVERLKKANQ